MAKFRDFDLERIEKNEEFWLDQCGIKINRDNIIVMGAGNTEFGRGILVPNELLAVSHNRPHGFLKSGMEKSFPVSIRGDLDKLITRNVRWPIWNSYLVYFRDRQEADVENDGLSADDLEKKEILGINCVERMIYEWQYNLETGEHLDISSITICSGSRDADGGVPSVYWDVAHFEVRCYDPSRSLSLLRSRAAAV